MNIEETRIIYKYRWRFIPYAWLVIFLPISTFLGAMWIHRDGARGGVTFLVIALSIVLGGSYFMFLSLSNIEIDENGIGRRAFAYRWQNLRWDELLRCTISLSKSPENGEIVRLFMLVAKLGVSGIFTKRIMFQERQPEMLPMLKAIYAYIAQHQIPVQDLTTKT